MTDTVDLQIRARFDAVANWSDDRDWNDVLARAHGREIPAERSVRRTGFRRRVPARVALVAAVVVLAAVVTAVAFGWPQRFVDFLSSAPAPTKVKNFIGSYGVGAPPGMDPRAIPGQARKIMTARFDARLGLSDHPRLHTLYVAPTKSGGFCVDWTRWGGGCVPAKTPSTYGSGPLGVELLPKTDRSGNEGYPYLVLGFVRSGATRKLEARFADGATATIFPTWVSAPINAGFVVYPVTRSHWDRAHALKSVVALDADGRVIGRISTPSPRRKPASHMVARTLPDGMRALFPRGAEVSRARKIISFRATDPFVAPSRPAHSSRMYLWLVPLAGGGDCFVTNGAHGMEVPSAVCAIPRLVEKYSSPNLASAPPGSHSAFDGGVAVGSRMDFFGLAKPAVATVELRYQNGERERLTPIDGFVLRELRPAHWKPGTRLVAAVALNRSGKAISTERFKTQEAGVYPCKKPMHLGYGVKECP